MTPNEISNLAAEEVFRTIERTKRINKGEIAEAIEKVLLKNPIGYGSVYGVPAFIMPETYTLTLDQLPSHSGND